MAGLLAWAADVVGRGGQSDEESGNNDSIPLIFTPEQEQYLRNLDQKAASLSRLINDLRLRIPPPDISQRLPHLHAHSLASNAALSLQLNAHSATREQAQQREMKLQEENAAYEKAISSCEGKIEERLQEAQVLQKKLKEMEKTEENLMVELENAHAAAHTGQFNELTIDPGKKVEEAHDGEEASESAILDKLERKKQELHSMEVMVQDLEKKWADVQAKLLKQPSPAQREKALDKQIHSLIEQLAAKQAQAEGLVLEINLKEKELEQLNGLWRRLECGNMEVNTTRNRFGRSNSGSGFGSADSADAHDKLPYHIGGRFEIQQRLRLLRSGFVLYILLLHFLVFLKISF